MVKNNISLHSNEYCYYQVRKLTGDKTRGRLSAFFTLSLHTDSLAGS